QFLINQGSITADDNPDVFLVRLSQGKLPVPGQVTSILLSLKVVFEGLREAPNLDRELVYALHLLASEGRYQFDIKQSEGLTWPPLLDEDLTRIAAAVRSIFANTWLG
ncbi:MAG: Dethiobiotin synthetase, partial [Cyanobacteria bacterium P01_F01_bin.53]